MVLKMCDTQQVIYRLLRCLFLFFSPLIEHCGVQQSAECCFGETKQRPQLESPRVGLCVFAFLRLRLRSVH